MDDIEKLRRLIPHWIEHNEEHSESYKHWAQRINESNPELSQILYEVSREGEKLNDLLKKAIKLLT